MQVIDVATAREAPGLRLGLVAGLPSPWGEAAKGLFEVKQLPFLAVPYGGAADTAFEDWTGQTSAPVAVYDNEPPRSGWAEILALAERLAPAPALIPAAEAERALMFGLCHEICGEMGFGWCARLLVVDGGMTAEGHPLPRAGAEYFAARYAWTPGVATVAERRVRAVLGLLAARLDAAEQAGSRYLVGAGLSAADIYAATFSIMVAPWGEAECAMPEFLRGSFAAVGARVADAVDPRLVAHRDFIYAEHLTLPVELISQEDT
ncbi:MAG: hypothetical protein ACU85V_01575 [Gammaproteobacteria bacterium]